MPPERELRHPGRLDGQIGGRICAQSSVDDIRDNPTADWPQMISISRRYLGFADNVIP